MCTQDTQTETQQTPCQTINTELAKKIGVDAALVFNDLTGWILHNSKNNGWWYKDTWKYGKRWTFRTGKQLEASIGLLPYKKILRSVNVLIKEKLIERRYFLRNGCTHSAGYALTEAGCDYVNQCTPAEAIYLISQDPFDTSKVAEMGTIDVATVGTALNKPVFKPAGTAAPKAQKPSHGGNKKADTTRCASASPLKACLALGDKDKTEQTSKTDQQTNKTIETTDPEPLDRCSLEWQLWNVKKFLALADNEEDRAYVLKEIAAVEADIVERDKRDARFWARFNHTKTTETTESTPCEVTTETTETTESTPPIVCYTPNEQAAFLKHFFATSITKAPPPSVNISCCFLINIASCEALHLSSSNEMVQGVKQQVERHVAQLKFVQKLRSQKQGQLKLERL